MKQEIVVIGAGVSGVPAAVAAAHCGARVLLLERAEDPGGTMTAGLGLSVCGLFRNDTDHPPELLNSGFAEDLLNAVCREESDPVVAMGRVYVCRCSAGLFKTIYRGWMDSRHLSFVPDVTGLRVETTDGKIEVIRFRTADGAEQEVFPSQVIDCTGSGVAIQLSGAERIEPTVLPLAGFFVRIRGFRSDDLLSVTVPYHLRKAVEQGVLPAWCRFTFFSFEASGRGSAVLKFSPPSALTKEQAFETIRCAVKCLQTMLPAFEKVEISEASPCLLQREGVRLHGGHVLCEEDLATGRRFDDDAVNGGWPMEYWDAEKGPQYTFSETDTYGIPVRCLHSDTVHNLWSAGRTLSATSGALSSARVIGTAIATGEAAGKAAAGCLI